MTIEKMDSLGKLYKTGKIGPNYQNKISKQIENTQFC